jgi:Flp pilus assembly pilin Flp
MTEVALNKSQCSHCIALLHAIIAKHFYVLATLATGFSRRRYTMLNKIKDYIFDENGAVTVEWVVLTAAVIGLGMIVLTPVAFSTSSVTAQLGDKIRTSNVGYGN